MAEKTGKQILDEAAAVKNGGAYNPSSMKWRAAITGGSIGLVGGAYWAFIKNGNLLVGALAGGIAGALVARMIMPK